MAFADGSDMTVRFDARLLGDLVADDNTQDSDPAASSILSAMLVDASAMVRAALQGAGRYSNDEISALETAEDDVCKRLTCNLALGMLYARRGGGVPEHHQALIEEAQDHLAALRKGQMVLAIDTAIGAVKPEATRPNYVDAKLAWPASGSALFPRRPTSPEGSL